MNKKFFMPFETAQALKAKGYPQDTDYYWMLRGDEEPHGVTLHDKLDYEDDGVVAIFIPAPTYHEVIDWLDGKDILIECNCGFDYHTEEEWYRCYAIERKNRFDDDAFISIIAPTREEALNAAILKALELI